MLLFLSSIRLQILPFSFSVSALDHPYLLPIGNIGMRCRTWAAGEAAVP